METATRRADAALVRRLQERDRTAWDEVYVEYAARLRAFALRLAGNPHDADDLVQETFVRALPRLDKLDADRLELGPYLFTTLRNTFLKRIERGRRVAPVEDVPEPNVPAPIELDPERRALLGGQREEVQSANARLAPHQRLVLALRELEDRSYAEIGEIVGLKENAVAQLILRARDSLRNELRLAQVDPARLSAECGGYLPLLSRHLDGQLRGEPLERTVAHLESCERCQDALSSMREASRRYRVFIPPICSDEAQARSIDAELTASGYWEPRRGRPRLGTRVGALAGVAALAVLGATGVGAALLVSDGEPAALTAPFVPPDTPAAETTIPQAKTRSGPAPTVPRPSRPATHVTPKIVPTTTNAATTAPATLPATTASTTTAHRTSVPASTRTKTAPKRTAPTKHRPVSPPAVLDRTAPTVAITARPPDTTAATDASFAFRADEGGATFACSVDTGAFEPCSSPKTYAGLAPGAHAFAVRARDRAGNVGPTATARWTIEAPDTAPPVATIASVSSNAGEAVFTFSSSEPGSRFDCALDGGAFAACASPQSYSALAYGSHTFSVRATDSAGNTGPDATHAWSYPQPLPDLVVSKLTETSVTVANVGTVPAGPFVVSVTLIGTFSFGGLTPGQSATRVWSACRVGTLSAVADRGASVAESDETNNTLTLVSDC